MLIRLFLLALAGTHLSLPAQTSRELRVGAAGHAFDHLGNIGEQSEAAAASGANIIYATALGTLGYQGLPASEAWLNARQTAADYNRKARQQGIKLSIGYVCATSIVKLDEFDRNWSPEFRAQFKTPPRDWLQQDRDGKPLPSWYGGDYRPACMNNPDWRTYEKAMVRASLEAGCDGIFFDNPTVHPQGCYCRFCMEKFVLFLSGNEQSKMKTLPPLDEMRHMAISRVDDFRRFRTIIARDFFAEIRTYARTIKRGALITANNSLNSPGVLYSQARSHGYSIYEMSKVEDFVVVEDMSSQPRTLTDGRIFEYGPTYKQLHAISHGKPVVAVTIADGDYHTAPNLVRLAMAEAAANGASYLSWSTWPEKERARMAAAIRPVADFLRTHEKYLNDSTPRSDAVLFLPMRRYVETDRCRASELATALTGANVQYTMICEDDFAEGNSQSRAPETAQVFIVESPEALLADDESFGKWSRPALQPVFAGQADWLKSVQAVIGTPSVELVGPSSVRVVVRDQGKRTIVHVLNLNVQKVSSFEDKVNPVSDVGIRLTVPFKKIHSVRALTADSAASSGPLIFSTQRVGERTFIETKLPRLDIATILIVE